MLNKIIDWNLSRLPKDPLIIAQYMYYLQGIIVTALIAFTFNNFTSLFLGNGLYNLFTGLLTGAFALMSLFSFRNAREGYYGLKNSLKAIDNASKEIGKVVDEITPEKLEEMRKKNDNKSP